MFQVSGKEIAQKIIDNLKSQPKPQKTLAAILVGKDPASISFLKQKEKTAKELGVDFRLYKFDDKLTSDDLRKEVGKIARLSRVAGVIVQLPLPQHVNRRYVLNAIPIEKDVDVLSEKAQEVFRSGKNPVLPPAVGVTKEILGTHNMKLETLRTAVVGTGFLTGKPVAAWLANKVKELMVFEESSNLSELKKYDLVITGVGKAGLIKPEMLKENSSVIDFGYTLDESGKIRGDFDASSFRLQAPGFYTPTPGGTGPILVAKLFENFYGLNS